jgi:CRP/FNR family cyclic AMP-dependent transcriptional regulator
VWLDSNHPVTVPVASGDMTAFRTITALLEAEPELGARLTSTEQDDAKTLRVIELRIDPGPWAYEDAGGGVDLGGGPLGFLVLRGVLMRQVELAGTCAGEVLTDGDFALDTPAEDGFVPDTSSWVALTPARIAIVDRRVLRRAARWPGLVETLLARSGERAYRLGRMQAIAQLPRVDGRVLALLWHLAERLGRVGADGVVLPLSLTHETLGRLVGARRPTVSLALKDLATQGLVTRRDDGGWQLSRAMPDLVTRPPAGERRTRRAERDPVAALADEALTRVDRLRAARDEAGENIGRSTARLWELRERLEDLRRESATLRERAATARAGGRRRQEN